MAELSRRDARRQRAPGVSAAPGGGRRVHWGRAVLVVVLALLVGAAVYGYALYRNAGADIAASAHNTGAFTGRFTVLLLGEGLVENGATDITSPSAPDQTDSMMLLSVNPATDQANVLSIPRDTLVNLPQAGGVAKINDANFVGGPTLAVKMAEQTLHVPVNYYVETTMFNFAKMVNALGGLRVYVPQNMFYGTATGKFAYLNIHLTKGWHTLNGYQVLQFVRFRNEALGDIGRIQQQQYIIRLILRKVLSPGHITALPTIITSLSKMVTHSNLTLGQMLEMGALLPHIHLAAVRYATLPGSPVDINGTSYWRLNQRLLPVVTSDILLDRLTPAQRAKVHIQVETGTATLDPAVQLTDWLKRQGFSVGTPGWEGGSYTTTSITNYTGDKYLEDELVQAVGGPTRATVSDIPYHDYHDLDVVIVVGSDFHLNPHATHW
jgi:LCP family protein required for cell wall assembly